MPSAFIVKRGEGPKRRFVVRFRRGGRDFPIEHGGSFPTDEEATDPPRPDRRRARSGPQPGRRSRRDGGGPNVRTFEQTFEAFIESRVDVSEGNPRELPDAPRPARSPARCRRSAAAFLAGRPGGRDGALGGPLPRLGSDLRRDAPAGARLRGHRPEPGQRIKRVKLPRIERDVSRSALRSEVAAIIGNAPPKWRLALRVLEQTGMRAGELVAARMAGRRRGSNSRFRIRGGKTTSARRWVAVPEWLMLETSGRPAHPTIAPLSGECSPERPGRCSGWRCGAHAKAAGLAPLLPARPPPPLRVGEGEGGRPGHRARRPAWATLASR